MIPRKLQKGQQFKAATVDKINEIIDYLKTQQIVGDGKTIKVSQLTSGVGLTVLNQSGSKQSSAAPFDYLYKLGLQTEGTINYLTVQSLQTHTSGDNHYQKKIDLVKIQQDGRYRVKCYMTQYPRRGLFDNGWTVYLTPSVFHTGQGNEPNLRGIFTFQLGEIQRKTTTITDEQTGQETEIIEYEILSQDTVGWVQYQDSMPDTSFAVYAQFVTPPADGDLVSEAFTLVDFKYYVNDGFVYFDENAQTVTGKFLFAPDASTQLFVNLAIDETQTCFLTIETEQKEYIQTAEDGSSVKNYTIAMIDANPYGYADDYPVLHQYIGTNIYFNYDRKVGAKFGDPEPSYLIDKLTSENDSITIDTFTDVDGYIKVNLESEIVSLVSNDGSIRITENTLQDGTIEKNLESNVEITAGADIDVTKTNNVYTVAVDDTNFVKSIIGGNNCSTQRNGTSVTINVPDCHIPITGNAPIQVTGSSRNGYVIAFNSASFVETINGDAYINVTHPANTTRRNLSLDIDAVLNCLSAGNGITITGSGASRTIACTATITLANSITNVLELDTAGVLKAASTVPAGLSLVIGSNNALDIWDASGSNGFYLPVLSSDGSTFKWAQGGLCLVSTNDSMPGYLVDKITVAGNLSNVFKFEDYTTNLKLSLASTPSSILPVISFSGQQAIWTQGARVSVNGTDNSPGFLAEKLTSEDGSVTITVNDGKLDFSAGGGKVKCTEADTAEFLSSKLKSDNNSISISVSGSGTQQMNLVINPEYFKSSDGSILITGSETDIDFVSAGMVKINADDTNGYLADKFTSSDESVTIAVSDGKIDLKSLGGKVKVTDLDQAEYLLDKFYSPNQSINIDLSDSNAPQDIDLSINPEYFISSDGSIDIQQADDGISLDFISNGMVKCSQSDVSNYLQSKLQSSKMHLNIEKSSNGVAEKMDININPEAFTSSDQSVTISEAATGQIDFTGAGKVQVNEDDTAGFLNEKLTSDDNSIIVVDNGSAMDLAVNPDIFYSSDDSIIVEATDQGIDFTGTGKVKVSENDENGYLSSKFDNNDLINFQASGTKITAELGGNAIISSDASIQVNITNGFADIKANGKVKCTEADTADYLNTKINVDASIAALIALDKQDSQILIKSALTGSGVLLVENGIVKALPAPSGKAVLAVDNGSFVWMPYSDCENACE